MHSRMRRKNMLTLLNWVYIFAIKNTGQYTTEEKLNQMWVLEPQAFEFAQKCYFKHSVCWSPGFLWNNAFLASFEGFNMLQGYPEREKGRKKKKKRRANVSIWGSTGRLQCACSSSTGAHINCTSHNEPSVPSELSFSADRGRLSIEAAFKGGTRARVNSNRGAIVAVVNTKDTCTLFGVFFFFWTKNLVTDKSMCLLGSSLGCKKSNTL